MNVHTILEFFNFYKLLCFRTGSPEVTTKLDFHTFLLSVSLVSFFEFFFQFEVMNPISFNEEDIKLQKCGTWMQ